jgi:hypothetical protein
MHSGAIEVQLHIFLNSALNGGMCSGHVCIPFTNRDRAFYYSVYGGLCRTQSFQIAPVGNRTASAKFSNPILTCKQNLIAEFIFSSPELYNSNGFVAQQAAEH